MNLCTGFAERKWLVKNKEQILEKYKPLTKATLIKNRIHRKNQALRRILKNENLMAKIRHYRKSTQMYKIHVYDAVEAFKKSDQFGFVNRNDFGKIISDLLISQKVASVPVSLIYSNLKFIDLR